MIHTFHYNKKFYPPEKYCWITKVNTKEEGNTIFHTLKREKKQETNFDHFIVQSVQKASEKFLSIFLLAHSEDRIILYHRQHIVHAVRFERFTPLNFLMWHIVQFANFVATSFLGNKFEFIDKLNPENRSK